MQPSTWRVAAAVGAGVSRKLATDPMHGTGLTPIIAVAVGSDANGSFVAESGLRPSPQVGAQTACCGLLAPASSQQPFGRTFCSEQHTLPSTSAQPAFCWNKLQQGHAQQSVLPLLVHGRRVEPLLLHRDNSSRESAAWLASGACTDFCLLQAVTAGCSWLSSACEAQNLGLMLLQACTGRCCCTGTSPAGRMHHGLRLVPALPRAGFRNRCRTQPAVVSLTMLMLQACTGRCHCTGTAAAEKCSTACAWCLRWCTPALPWTAGAAGPSLAWPLCKKTRTARCR